MRKILFNYHVTIKYSITDMFLYLRAIDWGCETIHENIMVVGNRLMAPYSVDDQFDCDKDCYNNEFCLRYTYYLGYCILFDSYSDSVSVADATTGNKLFCMTITK